MVLQTLYGIFRRLHSQPDCIPILGHIEFLFAHNVSDSSIIQDRDSVSIDGQDQTDGYHACSLYRHLDTFVMTMTMTMTIT